MDLGLTWLVSQLCGINVREPIMFAAGLMFREMLGWKMLPGSRCMLTGSVSSVLLGFVIRFQGRFEASQRLLADTMGAGDALL